MKKLIIVASAGLAIGALAAPTAGAHQVKPPGLDGECTTTLHAGRGVPAHTLAMPTAAERSPAVTGGRCV